MWPPRGTLAIAALRGPPVAPVAPMAILTQNVDFRDNFDISRSKRFNIFTRGHGRNFPFDCGSFAAGG